MKKMISKITLSLILLTSTAFADKEKVSLLLDWFVNPDHAAIIIAQQKGFFEKNNLEVEIIEPADPSMPPKLVAAKKADLAVDYQPQLQMQVSQGLPLVRIATLVDSPLNSLVVLKDGGIEKIEDLKGKKVGAWLGGNGEKTLRALNEEYKLGLDMSFYDGTPLEKEVEMGRLDACWQGAIKSQTVIKQGNLDVKLMGVNTEIGSEINAYPFAKNEEGKKLSQDISKVIKEMHEDGTLTELSKKWFDLDTTKK